MPTTFITYAQLVRDTEQLASQLLQRSDIRQYSGVLGIPRSGMLPAAILAERLHLPLGSLHEYAETGEFFTGGSRGTFIPGYADHLRPVIIVDDSVFAGTALRNARYYFTSRIRQPALWTAIYTDPDHRQDNLISVREIPPNRYFEWNLFQHPDLATTLLDIDGVLCHDSPVFDDDGPAYEQSLAEAIPRYIPRVPLGGLISMRLERWREITAAWLDRYGIRYQSLTLCPAKSARERRNGPEYGVVKGEHYAASPLKLCIESSAEQAEQIAEISGKPVICTDNLKAYN